MPEKRKFQGILQLCPSEMESRRFWCKVMWHANNKCEMYPSSYWWDTWDSSKQIYINQESTVSVNGRGGGSNSELDFSHLNENFFVEHHVGVQINTWRILKIITLVQLYQWYSVSVTPWKQITVLNVSSPLENLDVTFLSWQEMLLFTIAQCTMHCTIAQFQCTTRFQCTTDCVVKKTCYAICGKHLLLNVGMWGWFKADQLKYDHVAARKAWPQPLKSSINAPPTQTSLAIICLWPTYMITHIWPMVQPNKIPQNSYIYLLIPHCLHQFCHLVDIKDIDPLRYYH